MKLERPAELALIVLCVAGGVITAILATMHYALLFGDLSFGAACGTGAGCVQVLASRYGQWAGIPLALWGLWFYIVAGALSVALLLFPSPERAGYARVLWWLALAAVLVDAQLGWIMAARLERLCILCVATYAINMAVFVLSLGILVRVRVEHLTDIPETPLDRPRTAPSGRLMKALLPTTTLALLISTFGVALAVSATAEKKERNNRSGLLEYLRTAPPTGVPDGLAPPRGPDGASVTLVTFSDFLCVQCKQLSRYLEIVAANHRDSLRLVYRHLPLDADCNPNLASNPHPGACVLARAAECARRQGRFWAFHDEAFADPQGPDPERIERYAAAAGLDLDAFRACMSDPTSLNEIRRDIALAESLGVRSTPTTFVNGRAVVGAFKPWLWEEIVRTVTPARSLSGTERAQGY